MSLETALVKLNTSLNAITGLPDFQLGIPDDPLGDGPYPSAYFEPSLETYDYEGIVKGAPTSTRCEVTILLVINERDITSGKTLLRELIDKVKLVKDKLEAEASAGTFKTDGDQGFDAYLAQTRWHIRPKDPVAAARLTVTLGAYGS